MTVLPRTPKRIGIAADHGGFGLKEQLVRTFFAARFSGAERHRRRLAKVAALESGEAKT
jgi:ribose 5-phosphate isomerase RpiB